MQQHREAEAAPVGINYDLPRFSSRAEAIEMLGECVRALAGEGSSRDVIRIAKYFSGAENFLLVTSEGTDPGLVANGILFHLRGALSELGSSGRATLAYEMGCTELEALSGTDAQRVRVFFARVAKCLRGFASPEQKNDRTAVASGPQIAAVKSAIAHYLGPLAGLNLEVVQDADVTDAIERFKLVQVSMRTALGAKLGGQANKTLATLLEVGLVELGADNCEKIKTLMHKMIKLHMQTSHSVREWVRFQPVFDLYAAAVNAEVRARFGV